MNAPAESGPIRRIVLALGQGGIPSFALELALGLARRMDAELATTLIENSNLLRAAGFPFAREILRLTGTERPLDALRLADQLQMSLKQLRADLETRAAALNVRTSFRVLRASGVHAALEPASGGESGDLIFFSHMTGVTPARSAAAKLVVIVQAGGPADERVQSVVGSLLAGVPERASLRLERIHAKRPDEIVAACLNMRSNLLIMPATLASGGLRSVIERAGCPVLVVG